MFKELLQEVRKSHVSIVDAFIAYEVECSYGAKVYKEDTFESVCQLVSDVISKYDFSIEEVVKELDNIVMQYNDELPDINEFVKGLKPVDVVTRI